MLFSLLGWGALAVLGYFLVKFTIKFVWDKIDKYFTEKKIDSAIVAEIPSVMEKCKNTRSYEALKAAREKGYTHVTAKTSGGKIDGGVEIYKDTLDTPDKEVKNLLGQEKMVIIER
ncbi:MAG: hypothetical protein IJS99_06695 [Synergistaceae bacterium]|nr:hypothetical protein [Synergistaceae bacterium]